MELDLHTLLLADAVVTLVLATVLLAARPGLPAGRASVAWAAGLVLVGAAKAAFLFREALPAPVQMTAVNAPLLAGYLVFAHVLTSLACRPLRGALLVAVGVAAPATFAVLPATEALRAARLVTFTVLLAGLCVLAATCLQAPAARLRGQRIVQGALALHAAAIVWRAAYGLAHPPRDLLVPFAGQLAFYLSSLPVVVAATLGVLMMLHDRAGRQLEHLATHDALTGLLNRRGWMQRLAAGLARAQRQGLEACVLALDVDHFKAINDRFGHAAGDQVLAGVARAIRGALRGTDAPGRIGGEEFAVLLLGRDAAQARATAEAIQAALRAGIAEAGGAPVTVSVGAALASESDVDYDCDGLLRAADVRLYEAKRTRDAIVAPDSTPHAAGTQPAAQPLPEPLFRRRARG